MYSPTWVFACWGCGDVLPITIYTGQEFARGCFFTFKVSLKFHNETRINIISVGFVGDGVGFHEREYLVWYILFTLFVPYAMLPLPLKWCMIGGTITAISHIANTMISKFRQTKIEEPCIDSSCVVKQMVANTLLYVAINFAGMYTKYLTDRGQRLAFIETHKAMEHKKESEKEYQKTQRLLDSSKIFSLIDFLTSVHDILIKIFQFARVILRPKIKIINEGCKWKFTLN